MNWRRLFTLAFGLIASAVVFVVMSSSAWAAPETSKVTAPRYVEYKIYIVKEGDTLGIIARKFNVRISAIKKANALGDGAIYVGQKLRIPAKSNARSKSEQTPSAQTPSRGTIAIQPTRPNGFRAPNARKWIEVDLSQQRLYAHENGQIVFTTLISSGRSPYRTPIGRFRVWAKVRRQTMSGPGYRLPNVQWVMYFAGENAIHGTYWHNNFGRPMSHGCVNATNKAARWLYNWAPYGTIVVVHR